MAEKRKHIAAICLIVQGRTIAKAEIFDARDWSRTGAGKGRYRLRIERKWFCLGSSHTFLNFKRCIEIIGKKFGKSLGIKMVKSHKIPVKPDLDIGTRVRVPSSYILGVAMTSHALIKTEPILAADGRWYMGVWLYSQGVIMVPAEDIEKL